MYHRTEQYGCNFGQLQEKYLAKPQIKNICGWLCGFIESVWQECLDEMNCDIVNWKMWLMTREILKVHHEADKKFRWIKRQCNDCKHKMKSRKFTQESTVFELRVTAFVFNFDGIQDHISRYKS